MLYEYQNLIKRFLFCRNVIEKAVILHYIYLHQCLFYHMSKAKKPKKPKKKASAAQKAADERAFTAAVIVAALVLALLLVLIFSR
jgi:hypothetical protein